MSSALTGIERAWLSSHRAHGPFYIHILVEGLGTPDVDAWTKAMQVATEALPVAGSRVAGWACQSRWTPAATPAVTTLPPFVGMPDDSILRSNCDLYDQSATALRVGEGQWLLRVSHAALDGRGAFAFARALFAARRGEAVTAVPCRTEWQAVGSGPKAYPPPKDAVPPMGAPSDAGDAPIWERRSIGPVRKGMMGHVLHEAARLCGAVDGPVRFELPVDLRNAEEFDAVRNLTGMMAFDVPGDASPEDLREGVREAVRAGRASARVRGADFIRHLPVWLTDFAARRGAVEHRSQQRFHTTGVISNLGRMELTPFCAPDFEAKRLVIIPTYAPVTAVFLALVGGSWGTELVAVSPERFGGGGRLGAWLDAIAGVARSQDLN